MNNQNADVLSNALFYSKFLKAAIEFHKDPKNAQNLNPKQDQYPEFPAGYTLWANIRMNDTPDAPIPTPTHFGFIAYETNNNQNLVIAIRGTQTEAEKNIDFESALVPWVSEGSKAGQVEKGFRNLYDTLQLQDPINGSFNDKDAILPPWFKTITMIGHSLGSGLVTLYGAHAAAKGKNVTIYTLASPRVGNKDFVAYYKKAAPQTYRIYNEPDTVPKSPPFGYEHVSEGISVNSLSYSWIQKTEACYHSLYTYLFLLGASEQGVIDHGCHIVLPRH